MADDYLLESVSREGPLLNYGGEKRSLPLTVDEVGVYEPLDLECQGGKNNKTVYGNGTQWDDVPNNFRECHV